VICLDTNVVIAAINLRPAPVRPRLYEEIAAGTTIGVPAIVLFETRYGSAKSNRRVSNEAGLRAFLSLAVTAWSFEPEDAEHAGDIRADLERRGEPIGPYDVLIAAQARRCGAVLVTANKREFERVPGLMMEDWAR
jgi:tRNA(fMet)-specific endonuclease VapC